jgi:serine protease AprX
VVDTGADVTHPDLAGRVTATRDFTGQGFSDGHGHGTHVCGIASGSGAASDGKYTGVAPDAFLMVAKVLKADGAGFTSDVMAGVEWAVSQRAQVINLSLGSSGPSDGTDALSAACDAAWGRGVVVCVAAGNDGPASGAVGSPGSARKVITVGATDDVDAIAGFSSRGPTQDGRQKPDVCCPGVGIAAPRAAGTAMGSVVDDRYTRASGTSMATPHASGAAALILQANPAFTPDQVKGRLMETAKNLGLDGNTQGAGRASVSGALGLDGNGAPPVPKPGCAPAVVSAVKGLLARK